jgi:4-amino-4-deoxy-L-arabinose transferase-like glycosyltransferase
MVTVAYEFVEAFSSVVPQVRISQIAAVIGILMDVMWRISTRNYLHPSFVDIVPAALIGYYLGKRQKSPKSGKSEKSKSTGSS